MNERMNFNDITACGGNCTGCSHYTAGECIGCNNNGGHCVSMWENGCAICACCREHQVPFCGLCKEFPCDWIVTKLGEWDARGIHRMGQLAEQYYRNVCDYNSLLRYLLAKEFNCRPGDFLRKDNVLTVPALHEGCRQYSSEPYFFHMATLGGNAVITAEECLHPFLQEFMKERAGHWLFELPNLLPLEKELNQLGYTLTQTYHMFLPTGIECVSEKPRRFEEPAQCKERYFEKHQVSEGMRDTIERQQAEDREHPWTLRWFTGDDIKPFYGDGRFPNAICPEYRPERPDRIVVCAYDGETIMGMAGCSEDAPGWMQIGIDVMPEYRSRGIGTLLVRLLKEKVAEQGDIPFYGTSLSNVHSWNIALNSGFRPTWVEIGASKMKQ